MIAVFLVLLASPVLAQSPEARVSSVMARAEKFISWQKGKDAREIANLDRRAEFLYRELKPLRWKAVPALTAAAKDRKHTLKARLLATSFLALTADPAALAPLEAILLDPEEEPVIRSLAAQSLPGLGASDRAVASALCGALEQKDLPEDVARAALLPLPRLGCPDPASLLRLARSAGPRPAEKSLHAIVRPAIRALGRSRGLESGKAVLSLVSYFPSLGPARAEAIAALDARRAELTTWQAPASLPVVVEALRSESDRPSAMLALVRVLRAFGPEAAGPEFLRLASHPDAEVLAEAAEALAEYKRVEVLPQLEKIVAGAMSDPRFSPKDGRPDPAALLARLEKAVAALRRARTDR